MFSNVDVSNVLPSAPAWELLEGHKITQELQQTVQSIPTHQSNEFDASGRIINSGVVISGIQTYFAKYEIPAGVLNSLFKLVDYHLRFILDDSGSMGEKSSVRWTKAMSTEMKALCLNPDKYMTRWEELQDRLHTMIDVLAYIPTAPIQLCFLNSDYIILLDRAGKTPELFKTEAHQTITSIFQIITPENGTPIYSKLSAVYKEANDHHKIMVYLMTDGEPTGGSSRVKTLIENRSTTTDHREKENPQNSPTALIVCTNKPEEAAWTRAVDESAEYCAQIENYPNEKLEVAMVQGHAILYTKGLGLICQLAAALDSVLDNLDELFLTKADLEHLLGYELTPEEYHAKWNTNPFKAWYNDYYESFANNREQHANQILPKTLQTALAQAKDSYANSLKRNAGALPPPLPSVFTNNASTVYSSANKNSQNTGPTKNNKPSSACLMM